jgi:hypothetical protein
VKIWQALPKRLAANKLMPGLKKRTKILVEGLVWNLPLLTVKVRAIQ